MKPLLYGENYGKKPHSAIMWLIMVAVTPMGFAIPFVGPILCILAWIGFIREHLSGLRYQEQQRRESEMAMAPEKRLR